MFISIYISTASNWESNFHDWLLKIASEMIDVYVFHHYRDTNSLIIAHFIVWYNFETESLNS